MKEFQKSRICTQLIVGALKMPVGHGFFRKNEQKNFLVLLGVSCGYFCGSVTLRLKIQRMLVLADADAGFSLLMLYI